MTRRDHLTDAYNGCARAKKLIAIVESAQDDDDALNDANTSRLERAKLHALDAVQALIAALEKTDVR